MRKNIPNTPPRENVPLAETIEGRVMLSAAAVRAALPATVIDTTAGLTGTYYRGPNFQHEVMARTDADVDFHWGQGAPDPSLTGAGFSVRWTGQLTAAYSQNYTISTVADDGVRVWVGGKLVIDDWQEQFATVARGNVRLQAGQTYDIRIDYFENGDPPASVQLFWRSPSQTRQIVPTSALHTTPTSGAAVGSPEDGGVPPSPSLPAPVAPAGLGALATGSGSIHLAWGDVPGETGFVVQRSADGQNGWKGIATLPAGQTAFDDTGLASGTTYFYRVIATNAAGASAATNVASARTQGLVYALTSDAKVEVIDVATAASSQVGTLAFGTSAGDTSPIDGKIYYVEQNTSTPRVAVWDPATNTSTTLGTVSLSGWVMRAAFDRNGVLYVTAGDGDLYTVNTTTGAATLVGTITYHGAPLATPMGDMAFAPDGSLYLDENSDVYKVDPTSLAATWVGNNGSLGNVQAAFATDGMMYGLVADGDLYQIDLASGGATLVGNTGIYQVGDLAAMLG